MVERERRIAASSWLVSAGRPTAALEEGRAVAFSCGAVIATVDVVDMKALASHAKDVKVVSIQP